MQGDGEGGSLRLGSPEDAQALLRAAWPMIVDECRAVLGGELHYQAVVYHCLRMAGGPRTQIGMNVKQWIADPVSEDFRRRDLRKHESFRGGFEPIPDIVLFGRDINGDWRRRNHERTLATMLMAIEVKASERSAGRLSLAEVTRDIVKLAAHRDEVARLGGGMTPVMLVADVAPDPAERMRPSVIGACRDCASGHSVTWLYVSPSLSDPQP
ncbi:MAG: hypothetical protein ACT4OK_10810 [Gemmobacter sp.]